MSEVSLIVRTADQSRKAEIAVSSENTVGDIVHSAIDNWALAGRRGLHDRQRDARQVAEPGRADRARRRPARRRARAAAGARRRLSGGHVDPRARRREEDVRRLYALEAQYRGLLDVLEVAGQPPRRVRLRLAIPTARSAGFPLDRQAASELVVELPEAYPLQEPRLTITTPVFNPNVYASGVVCHGVTWMPTEGLDLLVVRVMRLLALDPAIVNLHSAANGLAAAWYRMTIAQNARAFPSVAIEAPRREERPSGRLAGGRRGRPGEAARRVHRVRGDAARGGGKERRGSLPALRRARGGQGVIRWLSDRAEDRRARLRRAGARRRRGAGGAAPGARDRRTTRARRGNGRRTRSQRICARARTRWVGCWWAMPTRCRSRRGTDSVIWSRSKRRCRASASTTRRCRCAWRRSSGSARRRFSTRACSVVGWYHSHPGLGAFFSGTDRETQHAFFRQPYSLGLVVDPLRAELACYAGPDSAEPGFDVLLSPSLAPFGALFGARL